MSSSYRALRQQQRQQRAEEEIIRGMLSCKLSYNDSNGCDNDADTREEIDEERDNEFPVAQGLSF